MSANAETRIKNLLFTVDGNGNYNTVWMSTALTFAEDSLSNRSDFRSAIPNGLRMKWGITVNGERYHDEADTWKASNIRVPGNPLSPAEISEIALWDGGTESLLWELRDYTPQARAAALVAALPHHKLHIAYAYPEAFFSVSDSEQATMLSDISAPDARLLKGKLYSVYEATPHIAIRLLTEAFLINLPVDVLSVVMDDLSLKDQKIALLNEFEALESRLPEFVLWWCLASWPVYFQLDPERGGEIFHEWVYVQAGQLRGFTLAHRMKELTSLEELTAVVDNWKHWTRNHGCGFDFVSANVTAYLLEKMGNKYQTYLDAAHAWTSPRLLEGYWGVIQQGQGGGMQIE